MTLHPHDTSFIEALYEAADNLDIEGIQEYISRPARKRIALTVAQALLVKEREEGNKRHQTGQTLLANELDVSRYTVGRWFNNEMQSCNAYTERLIKAAAKHAPERLIEILRDDIDTYRREVDQLIDSMTLHPHDTLTEEVAESG